MGLNFSEGTGQSVEDKGVVMVVVSVSLVLALVVTTITDGFSNNVSQMDPISHHGK